MIVLLIEDNPESLECMSNALQLNDFEVLAFDSPEQGIAAYDAEEVDVVISDFHLPGCDGIHVLEKIKTKNSKVKMIVISGDPGPDTEEKVLKAGAWAFFKKPLNIKQVVESINSAAKS